MAELVVSWIVFSLVLDITPEGYHKLLDSLGGTCRHDGNISSTQRNWPR